MKPTKTALIVPGGDPPGLDPEELPAADFVVAADSGLEHARGLRLDIDVLVGDMDSISQISLQWAKRNKIAIETHPEDKDATDLELAMATAVRNGCERLVVVGGLGGRLDHELATIGLLAAPAWAQCSVELWAAGERVYVLRRMGILPARAGTSVTLLAWGSAATGVVTMGLRWDLDSEELQPGSTRGVSNIVEDDFPTVDLDTGVLLAVLSGDS